MLIRNSEQPDRKKILHLVGVSVICRALQILQKAEAWGKITLQGKNAELTLFHKLDRDNIKGEATLIISKENA